MSHHFPSAAPQPQSPTPPSQSHSELAERIARFQTAAQDLLAMYEPAGQGSGLTPRPGPIRTAKPAATTFQRERCSTSVTF